MADTFIDTSAATNGDGSFSSPWNTFANISDGGANELTGDLGGATIYIKAGTKTREQLKLNTASNCEIKAYGDGDAPIINGSDIVSSWTVEGDLWYTSSAAIHAVFIDGEQLIDVSTKVELVGTTKQWFDSVNSRIYIDVDPTSAVVEITNRDKCIWLVACGFLVAREFVLEKADESNIVVDGGADNVGLYDFETRYAGGWNTSGRDGILVVGDSVTPDTGVNIKNIYSHDNQNCGAELHYLDAAEVYENNFPDNGNGVELWQGVSNSFFRRNTISGSIQRGTSNGHQNGFWTAGDNQSGDGNNQANLFAYNLVENCEADGFVINDGTGHLIYNNTIYSCGEIANGRGNRFQQTGTIQAGATFKNNIVVLTGATQYAVQIGSASDSTTKNNMVMQDNQYYHASQTDEPRYQIDTTTYGNVDPAVALSQFKAALPTPDTTSDHGDPLFVDTTDYELDTGSPCINTGSDVSEVQDFKKYPIHGLPDKGAQEKRILANTTVSLSLKN